jgi:NhaA family Na+:H+ antiporter
VRLGLADLPRGASWKHMVGAGMLAGIGFTMSIFITTLAFETSAHQAAAKGAILLASLLAGSAGMLFLRQLTAPAALAVPPAPTAAVQSGSEDSLAQVA